MTPWPMFPLADKIFSLIAGRMSVVLQVIFTTACELVRPKHVVPGTLKILQGQIQFTGDPPMDESTSALPDSPAPKAKVVSFL